MNQTLVTLLHGAGTGGWVWDRVRPLVHGDCIAPDVPSRSPDVTPALCASRLLASIGERSAPRVVLVMHSLAGVLAGDLGQLLGPRLAACVYVSAIVPGEGSTFTKAVGFPGRLVLPILFRLNPNGLRPSGQMIRSELCGDLSAADADMVVERYQPEFPGLYRSKVGAPPSCRSAYVTLSQDASVPPKLQEQMAARLPNPTIHRIESGHLPMLSRPTELAAVINQVVATA